MSQDKCLEEALAAAGLPVKYYEYEGTKPEYIVYNEEVEQALNYGDNKPLNKIIWWQAHLFTPKASDFRSYKDTLERSLRESGFIITDITTLYEKETKTIHVAISCHMGESEEVNE